MLKYAKVINEETKQCSIGVGTNSSFYQSIGMTKQDVEQAYDGAWYLSGYAPTKPAEELQVEVRTVRNQYLTDTDKFMIADYPIDEETKQQYVAYRTYLRDYTKAEEWYMELPKTFEDFIVTEEVVDNFEEMRDDELLTI